MKARIQVVFIFIALVCFGVTIAGAQIVSAQSGDWSTTTTWVGGVVPDSISGTVTILSGHNVNVAANANVGNLTVDAGGTLTLTCGAIATSTLTIASTGTLTVNGTFTIAGSIVATTSPYNLVVISGGAVVVNGVVNINATSATTGTKGFLPTATWQTGSVLNINAIGGATATGWGAGGAQNFYNINYGFSGTPSFGWGFGTNSINNLNVTATGAGRLQLFGGSSGTLTINGTLSVSGSSNFTVNGTSSATFDTVNVKGNVAVNTTGNFAISRGSQGGAGTSIFNFEGDVSIIAGTMQNSNTTPDGAKFRFMKNGAQSFSLLPTTVTGNALPIEIAAGSNVTLLSPVNVTTLYLNGGIITSSTSNPLIMGWWTGAALTSGTVSPTAPGSSTSYVNGPMAFLVAAAATTTKTYPIGKGGVYRPVVLSLTQSAATLSTYTAEMFNSAPAANGFPGTLDKASLVRYYTITETGGGSAFTAGAVTLSYDANDGVTDMANVRVAQGPAGSGTWVDLGGTGSANTTGTILSTTAFTDLTNTVFALASATGGTNPLPVEMTSFTASAAGNSTILRWSTATEENSARFDVERRTEGASVWAAVGSVNAAGTSNSPKEYSFEDKTVAPGVHVYRLKQIDNDGAFKYSASTQVDVGTAKGFELLSAYPNPFNPATNMQFSVPQDGYASLKVYNLVGQEVATLFSGMASAGHYIPATFNASRLASGIYFARLQYNGKSLVQRMLMTK